MTVSSQVTKVIYSGNGVTSVFPIPFPYITNTEIGVYYRDEDGLLSEITSNLYIDTALNQITYPVDALINPKIPTGTKLAVVRKTAKTQEVDLDNYGFFVPEVIESEFDKLTRITQELAEQLSRCVSFPVDQVPSEEDTQNYLSTLENLVALALQYKIDSQTAATASSASYDSFDDRYLGVKAADPALDNDGNALLQGAIYFSSTFKKMRVWNGTFWDNIGSVAAQIKYLLTNNQTLIDITGFSLDSTAAKSAFLQFEIERIGSSEYRQIIEAQAVYSGSAWSLTFGNYSGSDLIQDTLSTNEGITLSITSAGQFQYSTGNLPGHTGSALKVSQTRMEA